MEHPYGITLQGGQESAATAHAPGPHVALSGCVDCLQHAVDEARAAGLHGIAAELDAHRDAVAGLALRLWGEGGRR